MSYAIRKDGQGWRAVNGPDDVGQDEYYSETPITIKPTASQIIASFTAAIQQRLDDFARTRDYDSILSACTYAASAVPKFHAEGAYCVSARDATWAAANTLLAEHTAAGTTPTLDEVLAAMPALVWPT